MKTNRSYQIIIIILMVFSTPALKAQIINKSQVSPAVLTALTAKYPNGVVKTWKLANDRYTAKVKEGGRKYEAIFDKNGIWIMSVSKFNWPGHLSPAVQKAFKQSKYGQWHIYGESVVEKPAGVFYEVKVDNTNGPFDALHQQVVTQNRTLEFNTNGELIKEKNGSEISAL